MKIYLFDTLTIHTSLLPLSFTRPVADFRCGILTIIEKWQIRLGNPLNCECRFLPIDYLQEKYGSVDSPDAINIYIAGNILPDDKIVGLISKLNDGEALIHNNECIAFRGSLENLKKENFIASKEIEDVDSLHYVFDIFLQNGNQISRDFSLLTFGRKSRKLPECVRMLSCGEDPAEQEEQRDIFIEEGAVVECVAINTTSGPVYIGKDAVLMEGACIRGPFAVCEGGEVRMGSKIYEGTTIGPHCKVGGEVSNTVFFGYSNKAHDGYLGNAVIGEWCNIGAGTNASNLKNDYSLIRVWNYATGSFMKTDLQFCGLIMGDHSKIGVNCMINTATVIGVGVNLHGAGFPRTFVPCFSEGSPTSGFSHISLKKFLETATRVMSRRSHTLSEADQSLLTHIYDTSSSPSA